MGAGAAYWQQAASALQRAALASALAMLATPLPAEPNGGLRTDGLRALLAAAEALDTEPMSEGLTLSYFDAAAGRRVVARPPTGTAKSFIRAEAGYQRAMLRISALPFADEPPFVPLIPPELGPGTLTAGLEGQRAGAGFGIYALRAEKNGEQSDGSTNPLWVCRFTPAKSEGGSALQPHCGEGPEPIHTRAPVERGALSDLALVLDAIDAVAPPDLALVSAFIVLADNPEAAETAPLVIFADLSDGLQDVALLAMPVSGQPGANAALQAIEGWWLEPVCGIEATDRAGCAGPSPSQRVAGSFAARLHGADPAILIARIETAPGFAGGFPRAAGFQNLLLFHAGGTLPPFVPVRP